jgi:hypothetical protein
MTTKETLDIFFQDDATFICLLNLGFVYGSNDFLDKSLVFQYAAEWLICQSHPNN